MKELAKKLLRSTNEEEKKELREAIKKQAQKLTFTTRGKAKKDTGLSYIGSVNSSAKIEKNIKLNYSTYIVYLAPYKVSGHNTCSKASKGCVKACLNTSGRVKMDTEQNILTARLLKTLIFYGNRDFFNKWLFAEIEAAQKTAENKGNKFSIRLNGTSDLNIRLFNVDGENVLNKFSEVQFYDYTKVYNRLEETPKNYHLTFSFSGENDEEVKEALKNGYNVAIPFLTPKNGDLPQTFLGYEVGDADETDLRFLDSKRIAGLRVKATKDKDAILQAVKDGFIVDPKNV